MPLSGKVALVTGAGGGVGRVTSRRLAASGVVVGALGRRLGPLDELAREVASEGGRVLPLVADVADEAAVEGRVAELAAQTGRLDIVIHAAGVGIYGPIERYSRADWERTFATNLTGVFLCTRAALPHLRAGGGGQIIALASGAARGGLAGRAAYAASKAGLLSLMESLAQEVGPYGIKCATILPGSILTDFGPTTLEEKRQLTGRAYLRPDDVADAIFFLLNQPAHAWTQELSLWPR